MVCRALRACAALLGASVCVAMAQAADGASSVITILEGEAQVIRAQSPQARVRAVEGARLIAGDLIETAAKSFMQVELLDRTVIQLGPQTRLLLSSPVSKQKADRSAYLLSGWVKVSGLQRDAAAAPFDVQSSLIELTVPAGAVIVQSNAALAAVFVERGEVRLGERPTGAILALKSDQLYRRKADAKGALDTTSMKMFLAEMPPIFRDQLPSRLDKFKNAAVAMKPAPDFTYADVEPWLKSESGVRRPLMSRWRGKTRDASFRAALVANLPAHPEWDPILFPEKYLPKPATVAAPLAPAQ